jgi:hypothetical protein
MASPLVRYLAALYGSAAPGALIELRFRTASGMRQSFHRADALDGLATEIADRSPVTDVYLGVLPRTRRGGGRDDVVATAAVLWVDCDDPTAVAALRSFSPTPSAVVSSGTAENCHAYWLLSEPHPLDAIENANRRLAVALGADVGCADAARILRPPSLNHKHSPPAPVRLAFCEPATHYSLDEVVARLPDVPTKPRTGRVRVTDDPLLDVPPRVYVEVLGGTAVSRAGKVPCPLHNDRAASLHVYREPARGWYCYGCRRGGSIYDFAASLWGLSTRGNDFIELADALSVVFGPEELTS